MQTLTWLVGTAAVGILLLPMAAYANSPDPDTTVLPSMKDAVVADQQNPNQLSQVSNRINRRIGEPDSDTFTISDIIQSPLLDSLLDEDGQVTLPLGIRVYDTMGDWSVGFGSDF